MLLIQENLEEGFSMSAIRATFLVQNCNGTPNSEGVKDGLEQRHWFSDRPVPEEYYSDFSCEMVISQHRAMWQVIGWAFYQRIESV